MKKYITLAALLAAGTAFAAEEKMEWTINFGSAYTDGYEVIGNLTNKGTFWDVSDQVVANGVHVQSNKRPHLDGGTYGSWDDDFTFTVNLTLGENYALETNNANNPVYVFAKLWGSGTDLILDAQKSNNQVGLSGSATDTTENGLTIAAKGTYEVTLKKLDDALTLYLNDVVAVTGTLNGTNTGVINNITLGGVDGGANGRFSDAVIHSISYSTIPEPSAFGLLAGIGALALVASRRRRK